jgi:hypothetical protein
MEIRLICNKKTTALITVIDTVRMMVTVMTIIIVLITITLTITSKIAKITIVKMLVLWK